ncbi:hypothetical protein TNCV_2646771 [Trichonephila clavipes]|nr:hypothetical protein TNCV_2646771 [Trichonephila clavipes]
MFEELHRPLKRAAGCRSLDKTLLCSRRWFECDKGSVKSIPKILYDRDTQHVAHATHRSFLSGPVMTHSS